MTTKIRKGREKRMSKKRRSGRWVWKRKRKKEKYRIIHRPHITYSERKKKGKLWKVA